MNAVFIKEEPTDNPAQDMINNKSVEIKNEQQECNWAIVWIKEEYNNNKQDIQFDIGPLPYNNPNVVQKSINYTELSKEIIRKEDSSHMQEIETQVTNKISLHGSTAVKMNKKKVCNSKSKILHNRNLLNDSEDKLYTCEYCQTPFTRKSKLITHLKTHTENKPYQNSRGYKEKRYKCIHCDKKFMHNSSLKTHVMTHAQRSFHCKVCNKGFPDKRKLEAHMRNHNKMKSYNCSLCEMGFIIRNLISESGKKPYQCSHCGITFAEKQKLLTHHESHIKEN